jgi:hypothetical protein
MTIAGITNEVDWNEARGTTVPLAAEDATERAHVIENFMAGKPTYGPDSKAATMVAPTPVDKNSAYPKAATLADLAALKADPQIGDAPSAGQNPGNRPFNPGEFVATADGAKAYWVNGFVGWAAGAAPAVDPLDLTRSVTTAGGLADLAALKASTSIGDTGSDHPTTAFAAGQYVLMTHDGLKNHWDGDSWEAGPA